MLECDNEPYIVLENDDDTYELCRGTGTAGAGIKVICGSVAAEIPRRELALLFACAPVLLEACRKALAALNTAPRFKVPALDDGGSRTSSYDVAALLGRVIRRAEGDNSQERKGKE